MQIFLVCSQILLILVISATCQAENSVKKSKRAVTFPRGSSFGCIMAVAVPIDTASRNVYLSFTFEGNYALPNNSTHKDFIEKWKPDEFVPSNISTRSIDRVPFYTRNHFYTSVAAYFQQFGFNGTHCILRTICEIVESNLGEMNGVFGTVLHILFVPSTSKSEGLSDEFYIAEQLGWRNRCNRYNDGCPIRFLDLISELH